MATVVTLLFGAAAFVLCVLNIREKLTPKPAPTAHPLEAVLRDLGAAVREMKRTTE